MTRRWRLRPLLVVAVVALMSSGCAWVQRASVNSAGQQGDSVSYARSVSADGRYVAFVSGASNLGGNATGEGLGIFVRDTVTGQTRLVADDVSQDASISGDGRYVAFTSYSSKLVTGDTNGQPDIFVRDIVAGTTTRVSVDSAGAQSNHYNAAPSISSDGRYVAFNSFASNLVAGDTNASMDVFMRDTVAGTTTRVSVTGAGAQAAGSSQDPAISRDGRSITFVSSASNLVADGMSYQQNVFVRDRVAGTTTRADVGSGGAVPNGDASDPSISGDGRYVTFSSTASNLVAGDTNAMSDVFVRDLSAGTTTRISVGSTGAQANGDSSVPVISSDGRFVAYISAAANLVASDTNNQPDVFVRDRVAGTTTRVSVDLFGRQANGGSDAFAFSLPALAISGDGRYVAFSSSATNLVPGDTNGVSDVIVRANPEAVVTGVAPSTLSRGVATTVTITGSGFIPAARVLVDGGDDTVTNVVVVSPTKITARITFDADATPNARSLWVHLPGTGPGAATGAFGGCASCITAR